MFGQKWRKADWYQSFIECLQECVYWRLKKTQHTEPTQNKASPNTTEQRQKNATYRMHDVTELNSVCS